MFVEYIEFFFSRSIGVLVELVSLKNTELYHNQPGETYELTNFLLEPQDYRVYYVNIDLRHQYGISVSEAQASLLAKRPWRTAMNKERRLISQAIELIPISFPELDCKNIPCQMRFLFDIYLFI